jgi:enoyl-[acyl-carrier protein] reductase I
MFLAGKRILIMGLLSNRSIAYGVARACRAQGAELAFTYQNERFKERVTDMAAEFGSDAVFACDVGEDAQIDALFKALGERWDSLDGLVHAIAFAPREAISGDFFDGLSREAFRVAHDVSAYSFAAVAGAARPLMTGRRGALLTLSYLGAVRSVPHYNVMGMAKASLEASVRYMASSLGPQGTRVNAISAGPIKTLAASGIKGFSKLLDYAALDVWHLHGLRDILTSGLAALDRLEWLDQQCRAQIQAGTEGFAPATEHDWRIGRSERLRGLGQPVLHAIWHWRETTAEQIDTPPFKVCNNDLLLDIAYAAEDGQTAEAILTQVNLGKRHDRLIPALSAALRRGFETDPSTLPRRPGRDAGRRSLNQSELARLDRIKEDRDRIATQLSIEATLIANRAQLSHLAQIPSDLDDVLLPWQASLLRSIPSLKSA